MLNKIRNELMADEGEPLTGDVEVDETSWGGRPRRSSRRGRRVPRAQATVLGMVERGGQVRAARDPFAARCGP